MSDGFETPPQKQKLAEAHQHAIVKLIQTCPRETALPLVELGLLKSVDKSCRKMHRLFTKLSEHVCSRRATLTTQHI